MRNNLAQKVLGSGYDQSSLNVV